DVWIFQIAQNLTLANGAIITLSGGARANNIFWQVAGEVTLGTTASMKGNILCQTQIALSNGATLSGRALAQTAVTLIGNAVTLPAEKLVFEVQPGNTIAGETITPAVTVKIVDANNNLMTGDSGNVTLAIAANPGGGSLSGTTTVAASGGVATFNNLSINKTGTGYTLGASSPGLSGATSNASNINAGVLHHFAIGSISTSPTAGSSFSVTITAQDVNNNTVPGFTGTVGFTTNAGTISPTASNAFTNGQLTQNVTVTQAGTGKTITVTKSGGSENGTSNLLTINPGEAAKVLVETAADGSGTVVQTQTIVLGSSITVYAITRDANNNFVGNAAADSWVFINVTGGVIAGDLVQSGDKKSAVFTGNAPGTAEIKATSGTLAAINSGTITVSGLQPPSNFIVSDVPDDQGNSLKLTWTVSSSETNGMVSYYRIYRSLISTLSDSVKSINQFTDINDVTAWEQHATVLVDSVAAGTTEYTDTAVGLSGVPYSYWIQAVSAGGNSAKIAAEKPTAVKEQNALPSSFRLGEASPNPFNPSTTIEYSLPRNARVLLRVYNISGQKVATLVEGTVSAGNHFVVWYAKGMPSGVYFYALRAEGGYSETKKVMLLK
ncbi:MAG: ice-binding family protein, partial [Candidatus Latescibacterota bacterium]